MGLSNSKNQCSSPKPNTLYGQPKYPQQNIVISGDSGAVKIKNIDSYCFIREILDRKNDNLTKEDIADISKTCSREIVFEPPVQEEEIVEGFGNSQTNNFLLILFVIVAIVFIYNGCINK